MMTQNSPMMVRYDLWCSKCKNKDVKENDDPCEECLDHPVNDSTERPIHFKEK